LGEKAQKNYGEINVMSLAPPSTGGKKTGRVPSPKPPAGTLNGLRNKWNRNVCRGEDKWKIRAASDKNPFRGIKQKFQKKRFSADGQQ